ncbi:MAG TPA: tRNA (adenosine(37)-N6)-dimethylallyltransferase MiaA [Candidatus Dojkabacteria bacterium]|nr:tRNA (adenosine(37)-N6)-dimethylallyltransferase MiaA [Candidatus Dojkabacteria bacterium]
MKPIIVIAGTTASGKSDLALQLAKEIGGYIINADSRQIYKEFKIATAQPTPDKIKKDGTWIIDGIEHFLYGFVSIKSDYNIFKFQNDVKKLLKKKEKDNLYPILVGGTGLYIDSIVYNYQLVEGVTKQQKEKREQLSKLSVQQLQELAKEKYLNAFNQLNNSDRYNPRRLIRLIENQKLNQNKGESLNHKYFILDIDEETLEKNIRERIERMFEKGIIDEAKVIYDDYNNDSTELTNAINIIGFKELIPYFKGQNTLQEVKEEIFLHTRQYAKRQKTWFKRNNEAVYIKNLQEILKVI